MKIYTKHLNVLKKLKGEFFVARTLTPGSEVLKNDKSFLEFLEETLNIY